MESSFPYKPGIILTNSYILWTYNLSSNIPNHDEFPYLHKRWQNLGSPSIWITWQYICKREKKNQNKHTGNRINDLSEEY